MSYNVPNPIVVGSGSEIWAPLLSPNAENDEFNNGTVLSGWTRDYTPSATPISAIAAFAAGDTREDYNGFRPSWFRMQPPGDGAQKGIHKQFAGGGALPNGLYLARMGFMYRFGSITNNDGSIALQLTASSAGAPDANNRVALFLNESDAGLVGPESTVVNGGVATSTALPDQENTGLHWEYCAIIRNNNSFVTWVGTRQGSWTYIATLTYTGIPAIDRVHLTYVNAATTAPGNGIGKFDFFRYYTQQDLP